jgi:hypothetical protein
MPTVASVGGGHIAMVNTALDGGCVATRLLEPNSSHALCPIGQAADLAKRAKEIR